MGTELRVIAQLVKASDDAHLWSQRFDRLLTDRNLLTMQGELVREIAQTLRVKLKPAAASVAVRQKNGQAYRSRANAAKAVALDSMLAEAWVSLGSSLSSYDWDWTGAKDAFDRAIKLNPGYARAYTSRGLLRAEVLGVTGQVEAGIRDTRTSLELDPLNPVFIHRHGIALFDGGLYDESIKYQERALALADSDFATPHLMMGNAYRAKGDYDKAITEYEKAHRLMGPGSKRMLARIAWIHARTGRRAEAVKTLEEIRNSRSTYRWTRLAVVYLRLGQRDSAFAMLDSAVVKKDFGANGATLGDAIWHELRPDPRFTRLLEKAGLRSQ